jgi:hypothetical protein
MHRRNGSGIIIGWDSEIICFKYQCLDVFKDTWNLLVW